MLLKVVVVRRRCSESCGLAGLSTVPSTHMRHAVGTIAPLNRTEPGNNHPNPSALSQPTARTIHHHRTPVPPLLSLILQSVELPSI